jgi:hypothetical protein
MHGLLDAQIERFLRHAEELPDFGGYLAYTKRVAGVAAKAVHEGTTIYRNDVTVLQRLVVGNTVYNLLIHRRAYRRGKRRPGGIRKPLEGGDGSVVTDKLFGHLVELTGCHSWFYQFSHFGQSPTYK